MDQGLGNSPAPSLPMSRAPSGTSTAEQKVAPASGPGSSKTKNKELNGSDKLANGNARKPHKRHSIPAQLSTLTQPSFAGRSLPSEPTGNLLGLSGLHNSNPTQLTREPMMAPKELPNRKPVRRYTKSNQSRPHLSKTSLEPISILDATSFTELDGSASSHPFSTHTDIDERYEPWRHEFTPTLKDRYEDPEVKKLVEQLTTDYMASKRTVLHEALAAPSTVDVSSRSPESSQPATMSLGQTTQVCLPTPSLAVPSSKLAEPNNKSIPIRPQPHDFGQSQFMPTILLELPPPLKLIIKPIPPSSINFAPTFNTNPFFPSFPATAGNATTSSLPRLITQGVFTTQPITKGTYIASLKGSITTFDKYRSDVYNQYANLGCNKPHVKFFKSTKLDHAPFSQADKALVIDSRLYGNEMRFIRSGCHPNAYINVVITPHRTARSLQSETRPHPQRASSTTSRDHIDLLERSPSSEQHDSGKSKTVAEHKLLIDVLGVWLYL